MDFFSAYLKIPDIVRMGLIFSNEFIMIGVIILGLVTSKRREVYWGTIGLNLSIIINYALKATFKVPLLIHAGYAFPSGHMQQVTFLYGWLALIHLFKMQYLAGFIILAQAFGQIYFKYHNGVETLSGFAVGIFLLSIFYPLYFSTLNYLAMILLGIASLLFFYILSVAAMPGYVSYAYVFFILLLLVPRFNQQSRHFIF